MSINTIMIIVVTVIALVGLAVGAYIYFRNRSLEEIRGDVYHLFLRAEHMYLKSGSGKQKMKWVISKARGLLPEAVQLFVTDEFLERVVESWFRAVKDLLDDGKYNKSVGTKEEE